MAETEKATEKERDREIKEGDKEIESCRDKKRKR